MRPGPIRPGDISASGLYTAPAVTADTASMRPGPIRPGDYIALDDHTATNGTLQ